MLGPTHYVPVLKTKGGELDALSKFDESQKGFFTPLLELIPIQPKWLEGQDDPVPSKSIDDHVSNLSRDIAAAWQCDRPIFVDGFYLEEEDVLSDGSEPIAEVLRRLAADNLVAIPVVGINRLAEYVDACVSHAGRMKTDMCLRLTPTDLEDPESLAEQLGQFLSYIKRSPQQVHLVVDYGSISSGLAGALKAAVGSLIASINGVGQWKSTTLTATAFPSDVAEIKSNSIGVFERTEWQVWSHLRKKSRAQALVFGDYTVTHPDMSFLDPRKIRMSPKIKYCDELQWVIAKGEALRRKKDNRPSVPPSEQYPRLAKQIMQHSAWKTSSFSWGDTFIEDCANGNKTGNAQNWVTVGTVHHIALVLQQLANLP